MPYWSGRTNFEFKQNLETAHEHALAIKRHAFGVHERNHFRVLHGGGIDLIAMLARFVGNPHDDDRLVGLVLDCLWERRDLAWLYVVADARDISERAVVPTDLADCFRDFAVGLDVLFRNRNNEHIDVLFHDYSPAN